MRIHAQLVARATAAAAVCLLHAVPLRAQCSDPTPPPGGFAVTQLAPQTVDFADGAQTTLDVRHPSATPCPGGWPVVVLVHPLGVNRGFVAARARALSAQGYLTAAYDVRGQGSHTGGMTWYGEAERLDLAEIVQHLRTTYGGGLADTSRLGITGLSQGGLHAWIAAAWSGKALPANARGITTFPRFKAAVPNWAPPVDAGFFHPLAVTPLQVELFSTPTARGVRWDPGFYSLANAAIATEAFATLTSSLQNDPWRADLAQLATSSVPVLAQLPWSDTVFSVDDLLSAFSSMPATTPKRLFLSTPGHDEPNNARQSAELDVLGQRWLDRFLKGTSNGVELEPPIVTGVVPHTLAEYQSSSTLLWNRYLQQWPPSDVTDARYYLRQNGQLSATPPPTAEPADTIVHTVPAGASMTALMAANGSEALLRSWFTPASVAVYDGPALASDTEIAGSIRLEVEVTPTGPDYQVGCVLSRLDAGGGERYLQSGVGLVRGNASGQRLVIDFPDLHAYLDAGCRLRLKLQNVATWEPNVGTAACRFGCTFRTVPYFQSVSFDVVHTAARPSWIEIPVRASVGPALSSPAVANSVTTPANVHYVLDGTARLAGSPYLVLFGASGIVPPLPLSAGQLLYLNFDPLTTVLASVVNGPLLPGCAGTLSASGQASATFAWSNIVPFPTQLHRAQLHAAAVVLANGFLATNPVDLWFR